ncbi:sds22 [Candida oxycetoniae]|uniref:Sds22 n=1 Tax=Candida oxycetoniae TaxID=497107 RepID=A0AAI9T1P5_9ASCO|nr:sds22 [Candida oxycetoniae]KAI3406734.2 sds22 [Candida oxycetoniae]
MQVVEDKEDVQDACLKHDESKVNPGVNDSHTEEEEEEEEEEGEEKEEEGEGKGDEDAGAVEYPSTRILPDTNRDEIDADFDLTADLPLDTEYIDLVHLKISSLEDLNLSRFQKLEALCLRQNLIPSISGVKDLSPTLQELDFYDNRINHISSSIKHLTKLQNLDLSFNKIKNIKNLETLTELENLYFVANNIREIRNLDNLTKIKNLELGGNKIEVIENIEKLVNITQLWLGKNRIRKFQNLDTLVNLRVLSIQSNRIIKIEGLENLKNLEELYLSHNGIEKIEGLENNTNLQVLDVTSNKLKELSGLKQLKKLTDFWCSYNQISSFENVADQLGNLPDLECVYFEGNPIQKDNPTSYRRKLKLYLGHSLNKIDATFIHS